MFSYVLPSESCSHIAMLLNVDIHSTGDSGMASDTSNIRTSVCSLVGGAIGSPPVPAVTGQIAAPGATATGGTAGNGT